MEKVNTIVLKEWAEVFKNRLVLFSVAFLPLLFIALPIITMLAGGGLEELSGGQAGGGVPAADALCEGVSAAECGQIYFLNLYAFMFMILPVAIPVTIAAYSIVGEKSTRSLEPLLATPITTVELLAGKALAAIIPAVAATWISFGLFVVAMSFFTSPEAFRHLVDPLWLIAVIVVGPLLTLLAVNIAIMISSRVSDPRVAEQLSMIVILPIVVGLIGQSAGIVLIDREFVLVVALIVALIDAILVYLSIQTFQREQILTKWK